MLLTKLVIKDTRCYLYSQLAIPQKGQTVFIKPLCLSIDDAGR